MGTHSDFWLWVLVLLNNKIQSVTRTHGARWFSSAPTFLLIYMRYRINMIHYLWSVYSNQDLTGVAIAKEIFRKSELKQKRKHPDFWSVSGSRLIIWF